MAAKSSTARKRAAARRRTTAPAGRAYAQARRVKIPRTGPIHARLGAWMALRVVTRLADHQDIIRSRKDAAILRATHKDCPKCHGNGQIFTKGKDGSFTGSKPCPAPATREKVSRWEINRAARSINKNTGLIGWACPCGKKEKPRYRDAKEATKALRTHERQKHGGKTVGGAWYAQANETAAQPAGKTAPVSKVVTDSGKTDQQWVKQNKGMPVGKAIAAGKCWKCSGEGKLHAVFGNEQLLVICPECKGNGKAQKQAA
jgi:Zn finger protein HypA/HybF involved in hydrogenase expression